jgi:hypothetical protein
MDWSVLTWIAIAAGAILVFLFGQMIHLSIVFSWGDEKTRGLEYYGLPPAERRRFKGALRWQARLLFPILRLMGRFSSFTFEKASFRHREISGPTGTCNLESFQGADEYEPGPEDVFVVTQMKCGTTWMQHVVYETLNRGEGDLVESGRTLYAVSPWLEALKSVTVDEAPLIGSERPARVIKTHLPASVCPYSPEARYVYVARDPVSCVASCADFIATNVGAMAPGLDLIEEWFRSEGMMWWGTWPDHVMGWWDLSRRESNVLFLQFEEMKRDLPAVVRRVADFLGLAPLTEAELGRVVYKCSFDYMQEHREAFEMHPPHLLATDAELFVKGTADRHKDVPKEVRDRILAWCAAEMRDGDFPLERLYPDVAAAGAGAVD